MNRAERFQNERLLLLLKYGTMNDVWSKWLIGDIELSNNEKCVLVDWLDIQEDEANIIKKKYEMILVVDVASG